jgi:hypothetical protein
MKVALCLYGQPRTMEYCALSLKAHILDVYKPDVFACSDSQGNRIKSLYGTKNFEIYTQNEINKITADRVTKYGRSFTNPGPYKEYPIWTVSDLSVMYKAWRCREMLQAQENITGEYDVVIGTRFDAKFLKIQPVTMPEENTLYIPRIDAFGHEADKNGIFWGMGYCAHMWWCTSKLAKEFLDSYHWADDFYNETKTWSGEVFIKWWCDTNHIKVSFTDVTFMLIRGDNMTPREGLPPWRPLSSTVHPEYLSGQVQRRLDAEKLKNEQRMRRYKK